MLFDEAETRKIFKFFWPHLSAEIDVLEINNARRNLAQKILIVAIDSSYALGFAQQLFGMLSPQRAFTGLAIMGGKLAAHYMKHWWKHAKQSDLKKPRIAEAVRRTVANNFAQDMKMSIENAGLHPRLSPFYMAATMTTFWW